jgi:predicted small secreted protein
MKKIILTLASLATLCSIAVFTTGCNTMEGAGKDIERAGEKIENSAQKNK